MKNRQSRFTLNLEKPQKARPKNPPQAIAASGATDKEKKPRGAKRSGADIVLPGLDKDLFKEEGESALPDDSGGRDLAAEFQYETGTPVQSSGPIPVQPQQTYITQPGQPMQQVAVPGQAGVVAAPVPTTVVVQAPPPIYSQPPMYAPQPYPAYGAPPAQPPAPLPPPPPPPDYYGEPPDSVTGNESSSADETANEPSSSPAKGKKKPSLFVAMLPGGAGQFQNGDSLLGVAFGAAQIAGFYMYYSATQDAARNESQYKKYASEVSADPKNQDADYEAAYLAFKKNSDSQQQTGLMVFAGSYVASVAQAIFSMPSDTPPRKKKRRRYSLELSPESTEHYALDLKPGESIDFISLSPSTRVHQRSWHAQFLVTASPKRPLFGPGAKQGDDVGYGILLEYPF